MFSDIRGSFLLLLRSCRKKNNFFLCFFWISQAAKVWIISVVRVSVFWKDCPRSRLPRHRNKRLRCFHAKDALTPFLVLPGLERLIAQSRQFVFLSRKPACAPTSLRDPAHLLSQIMHYWHFAACINSETNNYNPQKFCLGRVWPCGSASMCFALVDHKGFFLLIARFKSRKLGLIVRHLRVCNKPTRVGARAAVRYQENWEHCSEPILSSQARGLLAKIRWARKTKR